MFGVLLVNPKAFASDKIEISREEIIDIAMDRWSPGVNVNQVYFDHENSLRWNDSQVHRISSGECDRGGAGLYNAEGASLPRRVLLAKPRVDLRTCPDSRVLLGINDTGEVVWHYQFTDDSVYVVGASEEAIVTSDLAARSPATGEVIEAVVGSAIRPDGTTIPRYRFYHGAIYRKNQRDFIVFVPEKHKLLGSAGLHRLEPRSGLHELILQDQACGPFWLANVEIDALRVDPSGRYLFLQRRCQGRGYLSWDALSVVDIKSRSIVFEERFENERIVSLACAGNGDVGIAVVVSGDDPKVRLLRYRITMP